MTTDVTVSRRRILLISPHKITMSGYEELAPPLGLAYIGAVLERANYSVSIIDVAAEGFHARKKLIGGCVRIGLGYNEIERKIRQFSPHIVGVSCLMSSQFEDTMKICRLVKKIDSAISTVVGGEHPSATPRESLDDPAVDFVVIGEGEYTMRELVAAIANNGGYSAIDGLAYRQSGQVIINPKTRFISNLDELPPPARHLLPMQIYFKENTPQSGTSLRSPNTSMITSRGCTARCVFCATSRFWGNRFRPRSVSSVLDEMEQLVTEYGIREIQFIDDNLTLDKKRALQLFEGMIARGLNLTWNTPQGIAAWSLDEKVLTAMKRSGCYEITLAIESGVQRVLTEIIHKPLRLEIVPPLVQTAKRLGILTKAYFVVGFPGESLNDIRATLEFARRLQLDAAGIFIATPLPGTDLYRQCKECGYLAKDFSYTHINYSNGNILTPEFNPTEVERLVSQYLLRINIGLLLRSPSRFFKKYGGLLRRKPKALLAYVYFQLKSLITG